MLAESFHLPCGATLHNRIAKAAMTERLAGPNRLPTESHTRLYKRWADTGAGLLISGNIMVDRHHLESAGNLVIEADTPIEHYKKWTHAVTETGTHFWAQISHAGRQASLFSKWQPLSASNVKLRKWGLFGTPRAMTVEEVEATIERYVDVAVFCQKAGFTGVEFHAAHGYLLNQFLSPLTNKRTDTYGGSIENRARILYDIVERARQRLGHSFPIAVKLNSADFQRGGFDEDDARAVIKGLEERGIDLLEISGGTYETLKFLENESASESTRAREAFFLEFAESVRAETKIPLMVTGGFRTRQFCEEALEAGHLDMIGFGRPFLMMPDFAQGFLKETLDEVACQDVRATGILQDMAAGGYYDYQLYLLSQGLSPKPSTSGNYTALRLLCHEMRKSLYNKLAS